MKLVFEVPLHPEDTAPKARARRGKHGNWYTPDRSKCYADVVAVMALQARQRVPAWPADAWYRLVVAVPTDAIGDWDNFGKQVSDACNRILWMDDRQVRDGRSVFTDAPCVCVYVEVLDSPTVTLSLDAYPPQPAQRKLASEVAAAK